MSKNVYIIQTWSNAHRNCSRMVLTCRILLKFYFKTLFKVDCTISSVKIPRSTLLPHRRAFFVMERQNFTCLWRMSTYILAL
jgi:hypothetical protein